MINGFTLHDTLRPGFWTAFRNPGGSFRTCIACWPRVPPLDAFMKDAEWSAPGKLKPAA